MQTEVPMLDTHEKRPLYLQLADTLLKQILDVYQPDDKLPTEMELCNEYAVSRTTVRLAMSELERRGNIYRVQGKGSFVSAERVGGFNSLLDFGFTSHCDGINPDSIAMAVNANCKSHPVSLMMLQQFGCQKREDIQSFEVRYSHDGRLIGSDSIFITKLHVPETRFNAAQIERVLTELSKSILSVRESYQARLLNDTEASNLEVERIPVLEISRHAYGDAGKLLLIINRLVFTDLVPYQNYVFKSE